MSKRLEDLEIYTLSEQFADEIWFIVVERDYFAKNTLGKQLARSADSIRANIADGFGTVFRIYFKNLKPFILN